MIDPKLLRDNIDYIKELLQKRNMAGAIDLDALKRIDDERRAAIAKTGELRETRNRVSKEIGGRKSKGEDAAALMKEMEGVNAGIKDLDALQESLNTQFNDILLSLPNVLDSSVPEGKDENDNKVVRYWGEKPKFDFEPKPHFDIGAELNILDFERGVKLAGARFYVYRGLAARLERAIINFITNKRD